MADQIPNWRKFAGSERLFGANGFHRKKNVAAAPSKALRHDPDERAGGAIENVRLPDDRWVAAEVRFPCFVAEDERRRSAGLVIGGLHHAAVQCGKTEEFKRVGRAENSVEALHSTADLIKNIFTGVSDGEVEDVIFFDVVEKFGRGVFGASDGVNIVGVVNFDGHEALGAGIWKRLDQNVFDDAEDCGGGADAKREGDDGNRGESGLFAQRARRVGKVAPERFERSKNPNFARALSYICDIAKLAMRSVARSRGVHSGGAIFVDTLGEVKSDFVIEIAIDLLGTRSGANALPDFFKPSVRHRSLLPVFGRLCAYAVCKTRAIAPDMRRQYSASCMRCFLPVAVRA